MATYKVVISYDGTDFSGIAEQVRGPEEPQIRTVIGELRPLFEMVAQTPVSLAMSGRTDKGCHARHQVLSFELPDDSASDVDMGRLAYVCNKKLAPEVVVHSIEQADENFHARYSAKARTYRYFIDTSEIPNPFISRYVWNVGQALDVDAMNQAAQCFVGEQDFTSVCKTDPSLDHNIREVFFSSFLDVNDHAELVTPFDSLSTNGLVCFEISANAFVWNMVRSVMGVLVAVGQGTLSPGDIPGLIAAKSRTHGCVLAPPAGLILWDVQY